MKRDPAAILLSVVTVVLGIGALKMAAPVLVVALSGQVRYGSGDGPMEVVPPVCITGPLALAFHTVWPVSTWMAYTSPSTEPM